jgi:hypothetical protein
MLYPRTVIYCHNDVSYILVPPHFRPTAHRGTPEELRGRHTFSSIVVAVVGIPTRYKETTTL